MRIVIGERTKRARHSQVCSIEIRDMCICNSTGQSEIWTKISPLPVLSQIHTIASFVKVKYLIFKLASTMSSGFLLLLASHDGIGLTFCVHRAEADSLHS